MLVLLSSRLLMLLLLYQKLERREAVVSNPFDSEGSSYTSWQFQLSDGLRSSRPLR